MKKSKKQTRPTRLEKILAWLMWVDFLYIEGGKFNIVNIDEDGATSGTCSYKEGVKTILRSIPFHIGRLWWNIKWSLRKKFNKEEYPF